MTEPEGFSPYQPSPYVPATQPPRAAASGQRLGRADGVQTRVESHGHERSSETVLSFRLVEGTGERPVEVELRGTSLSGSIRDGDWIEVPDRLDRSGRLEVAAAHNLTTGSQVTARGSLKSPSVKVFRVIFLIVFLAILVTGIIMVTTMVMTPF